MVLPAGVVLSETSMTLPDGMPFEAWRSIGAELRRVERSVMWWLGDWWAFGEHRYGERAALVRSADWDGPAFQTLQNAANVSRRFETNRRRLDVGYSHHAEVASLPGSEADSLLGAAEVQGWSVRALRAEVAKVRNAEAIAAPVVSETTCATEDLHSLVAAGQRFGCIYADPPWLYDNQGTRAATSNHYGGLTVDELCALPVRNLALPDAHLHLWTTNAFLFECPRIFAAWGFEFRSSFVWAKPQMGIGNYWRNSHEILLTAIRGNAKRFNDHSMMSWVERPRGKHSAKPEEVRGMLERASPGPYFEMFGRRVAPGWTVWGNQIDRACLFNSMLEAAE